MLGRWAVVDSEGREVYGHNDDAYEGQLAGFLLCGIAYLQCAE